MKIKPGDLFQWVCKYNSSPSLKDEELYSQTMEKYVPCVGVCLCIGMNDNVIHWVSNKGLFHAHVHKTFAKRAIVGFALVIPYRIE